MLWTGAFGGILAKQFSVVRYRNPAGGAGRRSKHGDAGVLERPLLPLEVFLPSQIPHGRLAVPPMPRVPWLLPLRRTSRLAMTASQPSLTGGAFYCRKSTWPRSDCVDQAASGIMKAGSCKRFYPLGPDAGLVGSESVECDCGLAHHDWPSPFLARSDRRTSLFRPPASRPVRVQT
jgi:hypothetical protein